MTYPNWIYYPTRNTPPIWVHKFVDAVSKNQDAIDTASVRNLTSDKVLEILRTDLERLRYEVERGKRAEERIRRPVLFGMQGESRITYEVDAYHPDDQILVEIEAGRGWMGNAVYRDLVRTSLIVDAKYLVLGVMNSYHYKTSGKNIISNDFDNTRDLLEALYGSGRMILPFDGILLFGY